MKLEGNYFDHPTRGLSRVPNTVMLNRDIYAYDPDLGFIKKAYRKTLGRVMKPVERAARKLVPKQIRKLVPNELKGNILKPAALAAGGYGLYTLGAGGIAAGAASAAKTAGGIAAKIGSGALTAVKVAAPVVASGMMTAGKAAGQVGTAVMEVAPAYLQAQQAINQQRAQAEFSQWETETAMAAHAAQREHEMNMQRMAMAQSQSSIPAQGIVYPGGYAPQSPGQRAGGSGIDMNIAMLAGVGVLTVVLLSRRK